MSMQLSVSSRAIKILTLTLTIMSVSSRAIIFAPSHAPLSRLSLRPAPARPREGSLGRPAGARQCWHLCQ